MNFKLFEATARKFVHQRLELGPLNLKASALPLNQAGTCMLKMGTMFSTLKASHSWCLAD